MALPSASDLLTAVNSFHGNCEHDISPFLPGWSKYSTQKAACHPIVSMIFEKYHIVAWSKKGTGMEVHGTASMPVFALCMINKVRR